MNKNFRLGADAGNISVLDSAYILENHGVLTGPDLRRIPVTPGIYDVSIDIPNTHNGVAHASNRIEVRGSYLIVGDACYSWSHSLVPSERWTEFLTRTDYLEDYAGRGVSCDTGGDGGFMVHFSWERVSDLVPAIP